MNRFSIIFYLCVLVWVSSCSPAVNAIDATTTSRTGQATQSTLATGSPAAKKNLIVYAAASLTGAFKEIGTQFELEHPGVQVSLNLAGSQILRTQLEQGAQADVFASADHQNMDLLAAEQLIAAETITEFVTNSLIIILPASNPGQVTTLKDLARQGVKVILADASVPAGAYARQVLEKMSQDAEYGSDFSTRVLENVVSNETDVKQVVAKVELGEADAGIVYKSDAVATPELGTLSIPAQFNIIASYPIAVLRRAPEAALAAEFINFVTSPEGQNILEKWGFNPVTA